LYFTFQRKSRDKLSSDKIKRDKLFPFGNAKLATPPLIFRVGGVFITAQHFNNFFWGFVWWCCEFDLPLQMEKKEIWQRKKKDSKDSTR
jgi:hypothetical protein